MPTLTQLSTIQLLTVAPCPLTITKSQAPILGWQMNPTTSAGSRRADIFLNKSAAGHSQGSCCFPHTRPSQLPHSPPHTSPGSSRYLMHRQAQHTQDHPGEIDSYTPAFHTRQPHPAARRWGLLTQSVYFNCMPRLTHTADSHNKQQCENPTKRYVSNVYKHSPQVPN